MSKCTIEQYADICNECISKALARDSSYERANVNSWDTGNTYANMYWLVRKRHWIIVNGTIRRTRCGHK